MTPTHHGSIKKVVADKGFGFVKPKEAGARDVFFHVTGCADKEDFLKFQTGDPVTYEEQPHEKGPRAVNVRFSN